jgi:hypothetical protein
MAVREKVPLGANRIRVTEPGFAENLLDQPLKQLSAALKELATDPPPSA